MGQASSAFVDLNRPQLEFLSPPVSSDEPSEDLDYSGEIPDECLAYIFQFLNAGDRKRCSVVCKRWLQVDGQSRHRIALNAQSEILTLLPSIFARFDSVTKLALRCDRKAISLNDEALIFISLQCRNLTRLKLRGCRQVTDLGMESFAKNCKSLKKLSCCSCAFGAKALNAVLEQSANLEELSVKKLRQIHDKLPIHPGAAASSLKSICLKELVTGQSFESLVTESKNLKTLKIIRCFGDWDNVLKTIGNKNSKVTEIHLERLQVSDTGLYGISKIPNVEILHLVKIPESSNLGLISIAERCKLIRKLHIDGWRTNRIGDEGLIAVAQNSMNLQELILLGVSATGLSLSAIATNCLKLERLAICGSETVGDDEIACIASKCVALRKFCIKGCPISDIGIESICYGCPNLVKLKVKRCKKVSVEVGEWLRDQRRTLVVNLNDVEVETGGVQEIAVAEGPGGGSTGRIALFRAAILAFLANRNITVACVSRRLNNIDDNSYTGNNI